MPTIRAVQPDDEPLLWNMLWEAAAVAPAMRAIGREAALARPESRKYLDGWGRPGDAGVVAVDETDQRLGAAWYRRFPVDAPGYGFVAPDIPELAIGVIPGARGRGIGTALLDALVRHARANGERALSLSVDRQNPALALYERNGFRDAGISNADDSSLTMIVVFANAVT